MKLFFAGGEIPSHLRLLKEADAKHVSLSFMGLYRRSPRPRKPWLVREKFWPGVSVFLDSGSFTLNNSKDPFNEDDALEVYEHYQDFVNANLDDVDLVSEFDVSGLGLEWIEEERAGFWSTVPKEKFMAIWHPEWGVPYLQGMAARYEIVGIPSTSLEGKELRPILNSLASKGTRIHGVAMTRKEEMQTIKWDSVSSTSWITPARFGDTIVWAGNDLKRYPKKMKDEARKKHRTLFKNEGFNAEAIANNDSQEVLRLSIWSWQQFEAYINKHGVSVGPVFSGVVTHPEPEDTLNEENPENPVGTQPEKPVQTGTTPSKAVLVRREVSEVLPVMGLHKAEKKEEEDEEPVPTVIIRSESARVCNDCFLASKCPMFEPNNNCAYAIPITIRTREQFRALRYGLVEMQAQRVMFMKMAEDMEGGYADPNLTKELNLLDKMMNQVHQEEQEGFSIQIKGSGSANAASSGAISRIFGSDMGQQVQALPAPVQADEIIDIEFTESAE